MRRTKEEAVYALYKRRTKKIRYVFRWATCRICEDQFRREYGWKFKWNQDCGPSDCYWIYKYACLQCLPTEKEAIDYIKNTLSLKEL